MSLLVFPIPAFNGQIYPTVPIPGQNVYQWSAIDQTWLLLGTATGVIPATYGNSLEVGQLLSMPLEKLRLHKMCKFKKLQPLS